MAETVNHFRDTAISTWSESKRKEFTGVFEKRVDAAVYILEITAYSILRSAYRRKFISKKHLHELNIDDDDIRDSYNPRRHHGGKIGDRKVEELNEIADQRAASIIQELPPLRQAVQVIDPDTAAKIERKEKLLKEGKVLAEKFDEMCEIVTLEDLDSKMTLQELKKFIKDRDRKLRDMIARLNEIGREGSTLEDAINKKLYRGLPGLTEAVLDVVRSHFDRAKAMGELARRIGEQVQFGDSDQAMALLKSFEADEIILPEAIKSKISAAVASLKLSRRKVSK